MIATEFFINSTRISYLPSNFPLHINSFPNPYEVSTIDTFDKYQELLQAADFIIIDKNISDIYKLKKQGNAHVFKIEATETNKNMGTVLELIEKLIQNNISKGSNVIAIGGGIVQDITACACALFRRGQPFIYLPTTSLGQLDSCVGAKCAINTENAKNIIGLFSAPRKVIIPTFMIKTMMINDHRAGLAEMLRLCLTASDTALEMYNKLFEQIKDPSILNEIEYTKALSLSLSIKKSVVDYDEYEKDIRRSMNYGHTFGHAIEKLVDFTIPHGIAVLIGMHMANHVSYKLGSMDKNTLERISEMISMTIRGTHLNLQKFVTISPEQIIDQFKFDKKGDGKSVPLILINEPGKMYFYRYSFDSNSEELKSSVLNAFNDIREWTK